MINKKNQAIMHILLSEDLNKNLEPLEILKTFRLSPKKLKQKFDSLRMFHSIDTYRDIFHFMKHSKNMVDVMIETELLLLKIMSDYIPLEVDGEAISLKSPYFHNIRAWAINRQMKLYQKMAQPLIDDSTFNMVLK